MPPLPLLEGTAPAPLATITDPAEAIRGDYTDCDTRTEQCAVA